jgi:hypothetical protein
MIVALQWKSITVKLVVLQMLNHLRPQFKLSLACEALRVSKYVQTVLGARQSDADSLGGFEDSDLSRVEGANQREKNNFILLALVIIHVDYLDLAQLLLVNLVILDEVLDL